MANNISMDSDRRNSVRVAGRNLFYCEPITRAQFKSITDDYKKGIPPYNQEGLSDVQVFIGAQSALSRIKEKDRDLGEFLSHLDTKLNLMLKMLDTDKGIFDQMSVKELNMSGSGIDFIHNTEYDKDTVLAFHITLLPEYSYIYCLAKVKSCSMVQEVDGEKYYRLAAEFILIMEEDRELIIQNNFKQQGLALRNKRRNE
jgi:hypothetical protein